MANPYYGVSNAPAAQSRGSSGVIRSEFMAIQGGFDLITMVVNGKGAIAGQERTGTHVFPSTTSIGNVSAAEIAFLDGVTSSIQAQIDAEVSARVAAMFSSALPGQAGNAGKFVTTNGTTASWAAVNTTPFSNSTALAQVQAAALSF